MSKIKVSIYSKKTDYTKKIEAAKKWDEKQKAINALKDKSSKETYPLGDFTKKEKFIKEEIEKIPTYEHKFNGYFHCWKQASDEDSHWAIGIVEDTDGYCHEIPCEEVRFHEWK